MTKTSESADERTSHDEIDSRGEAPPSQRSLEVSERALKYAEKVSMMYRSHFLKAASGELSPRQAIRAQCYQCVGYENVAKAIADCRGFTCPLYAYRPYGAVQQ